MSDFTLFKKYDIQTSSITAISYSPDSMKLAVGSKNKMFQIVDVNSGMPVFSKILNSSICSLKWSKFLLVLGCEDGGLSIWDMFEVKLIMEINAHEGKCHRVLIPPSNFQKTPFCFFISISKNIEAFNNIKIPSIYGVIAI